MKMIRKVFDLKQGFSRLRKMEVIKMAMIIVMVIGVIIRRAIFDN